MTQQNVKPNRMELLNIKKRIQLATKGHKLLKDKRDALFNEFFSTLNTARDLRKDMETSLSAAHASLAISETLLGSIKIEEFARVASQTADISIKVGQRNIMGVRVPKLEDKNLTRTSVERGYSLLESNASLDKTAVSFEITLGQLVKLAEMESALMNLSFEIEKTKRKVNALEYVIIPGLNATKKYIAFRLEEMERDKFVTLKKIKKKIDAKAH
jgi:V/A-type H+/Na+-transporting ATPase subunit D